MLSCSIIAHFCNLCCCVPHAVAYQGTYVVTGRFSCQAVWLVSSKLLHRACSALMPSRLSWPPAPASAQRPLPLLPTRSCTIRPLQRPDQAAPRIAVQRPTAYAIGVHVRDPRTTYSPRQVRWSQNKSEDSHSHEHQLLLAHSLLYTSLFFT